MIDIEDKTCQPGLSQLSEFVECEAFDALGRQLESEFQARCTVQYSGDKVLLGWNVRYKKGGKTLCTLYPRRGHFPLLLVVGQKEKQQVEDLLPELCEEFQRVYAETKEGMGQRWLLFDLSAQDELYRDILKVVAIRRRSK